MISPIINDSSSGIAYRRWSQPGAKAVFILIHGLGAHSGRWEFLADFLSNNGFASFALELRGFGQSGTTHGYVSSIDCYLQDVARLKSIASREHPSKKVFLVGESMGGLIAYLAACADSSSSDGIICMSPAFGNRLPFGPVDYAAIFYSFFFCPMKTFRMPFGSQMCTRDPLYRKIMDESAEESRVVTGRILGSIAIAQMKLVLKSQKILVPVLFLVSGSDTIVDPETTKSLFHRTKAADKTMIEYQEMYHALSVDLGREKVFFDILDWVDKRI